MSEDDKIFQHPASRLSFEVFRLNGALIGMGDRLTAPFGITAARWQVMGAVVAAQGTLPVAGIARNMGLVRQSVQRITDELCADGFVRYVENPHHRKAKLVQLTDEGAELFYKVSSRWLDFAEGLLKAIGSDDIAVTVGVLERLRAFLDNIEG